MKASERKQIIASLIQSAWENHRYGQKDWRGGNKDLARTMRGQRNGLLMAARQIKGRDTQAYFVNLYRRRAA